MITNFFKRLFQKKNESGNVAKQRLKFALIYDHLEISEDILGALHKDMVEVISRYFEIDQEAFKLDIRRSDELSALVVNTPILSAKRKKKEAQPDPT